MAADLWSRVGRPAYVHVNLDAITHNIRILRARCPKKSTGMIAVVKAGGYGHGSVMTARHMQSIGVERFAVATVDEAVHLRKHGIDRPIHVLGNCLGCEMTACLHHSLIPSVCSVDAIEAMSAALANTNTALAVQENAHPAAGSVHIKIDTGMCRNGCQPAEFQHLVKRCRELNVPLEGAFTHFADSWDDPEFTDKQMKTFQQCVKPYSELKLHVANSGAVIGGIGTDLDFIRTGIAMYGLPPGDPVARFSAHGFTPAASIKGMPTLVKQLEKDLTVGYSRTYTTPGREWVATFPVGYADGYWRHLSSDRCGPVGFVIRDKSGEKCPVLGRVSMDAITVRLSGQCDPDETFTLMTADYDPQTSASGIASMVGTIAYEVATRLSSRYPRAYTSGNCTTVVTAIQPESY